MTLSEKILKAAEFDEHTEYPDGDINGAEYNAASAEHARLFPLIKKLCACVKALEILQISDECFDSDKLIANTLKKLRAEVE